MKAGAWSFYLPKSRPRASHWHLQITKTSLGLFSGNFGSLFCAFSWAPLVLWCWKMQGLSWSFDLPESRLRKSRWRRDLTKKEVFGNFSERFGSLRSVFFGWVAWIGLQLCRREAVAHSSFDSIQSQLRSSHPAQERNEKSERKRLQNAEKLGLLLPPASAAFAAWDFLSCFGLPGVALAA